MSLTEPTAWPAATDGDDAPAGEPVRMPGESPRTWSYLRSMNGGQPGDARDWADDDRLDELFSAWAKAAVATDAVPAGFAGADDAPSRPVPLPPTEVAPTAVTPSTGPEIDPFARAALEPDDAFGVTATVEAEAPWEPVTAWSRTDDDIIPKPRRGRWGRGS